MNAARYPVPAEHFQDHIFSAHPRGQLADQPHAPDLRHSHMKRQPCRGGDECRAVARFDFREKETSP